MSVNHFSSDLPEAVLWWAQSQPHYHHHPHHNMEPSAAKTSGATTGSASSASFWGDSHQLLHHRPAVVSSNAASSSFNFDLNNEDEEETTDEQPERESHQNRAVKAFEEEEEESEIPKEPLFEKPLTPSDVGKLNRLVIPKQHAEKYFPLNGGNDSAAGGEKGLLLSFEDELGKPWQFRYSYWNSSQSYVLTKGWSRFVKEKRLDAGDIVLFERHRLDGDKLFIGWRRRTAATSQVPDGGAQPTVVGGGGWTRLYFPSGHGNPAPYPSGQQQQPTHHRDGLPYQPGRLHAGGGTAAASVLQQNQTTTSANSKRLRLFGVNLECHQQQPEEMEAEPPPRPPDQDETHQGQPYYPQFQYCPKVHRHHHHANFNHQNQMNINFPRDASQARYRQG